MATITSKGQITIPAEVREGFDLRQGDELEFFRSLSGDLAVCIRRRRKGAGRGMITQGLGEVSRETIGNAIATGVQARRKGRRERRP